MKLLLLPLCCLFFAISANCAAQDTNKVTQKIPPAFWAEFGYGFSSLGGYSVSLNANAQITQSLFLTAVFQGESNQALSVIDLSARHEIDLNTTGIMIGKISKHKYSMVTYAMGFSYAQYQNEQLNGIFSPGQNVIVTKHVVGVPVLVRVYWVLGQCVTLGAGVYGNFNTQQCTGGGTLLLGFGRIQTHQPKGR